MTIVMARPSKEERWWENILIEPFVTDSGLLLGELPVNFFSIKLLLDISPNKDTFWDILIFN